MRAEWQLYTKHTNTTRSLQTITKSNFSLLISRILKTSHLLVLFRPILHSSCLFSLLLMISSQTSRLNTLLNRKTKINKHEEQQHSTIIMITHEHVSLSKSFYHSQLCAPLHYDLKRLILRSLSPALDSRDALLLLILHKTVHQDRHMQSVHTKIIARIFRPRLLHTRSLFHSFISTPLHSCVRMLIKKSLNLRSQ